MEFWRDGKPGGGKSPSPLMFVYWGTDARYLFKRWNSLSQEERMKGKLV